MGSWIPKKFEIGNTRCKLDLSFFYPFFGLRFTLCLFLLVVFFVKGSLGYYYTLSKRKGENVA